MGKVKKCPSPSIGQIQIFATLEYLGLSASSYRINVESSAFK
jgi:hypothetical protein